MDHSLSTIFSIGNGATILPYITLVEKNIIQHACDFPLDTKTYPVLFYGISEEPPYDSIFYALLTQQLDNVKQMLEQDNDLVIIRQYAYRNQTTGQWTDSDYRMTTESVLWMGMNPLEIAYLMEYTEAISLLGLYNRTTIHSRGTYSIYYGKQAIKLARNYNKAHIALQLEELQK